MSKIFKTLVILFIILFSATTLVHATDINMNLENPNQTDTNSTDLDTSTDNTNDIEDTSATDTNTNETTDTNAEGTNGSLDDNFEQDNIGGSVAPSGVSSIAQENMSFSNILNILIITVGVVLILLAIAILIRLKS